MRTEAGAHVRSTFALGCGALAGALFGLGWLPPALGRGDPLYPAWIFSILLSLVTFVAAGFAARERRPTTLVAVALATGVLAYFVVAAYDINSF